MILKHLRLLSDIEQMFAGEMKWGKTTIAKIKVFLSQTQDDNIKN